MPIGRWIREGKFSAEHGAGFPGLDASFVQRKYRDHLCGNSDERLFLWCHGVLQRWVAKS